MIYSIESGIDGFWYLYMGCDLVLTLHDDEIKADKGHDSILDYMISVWINMD